MCLLVLHISDIHIKGSSDKILGHAKEIAACTFSSLRTAEMVVIVVSGDVAYSGKQSEYEEAKKFLFSLRDKIKAEKDIPVEFIVVPGNHDCDFSKNKSTRQAMVSSIEANSVNSIDADIINLCTEIQDDFFNFREMVESNAESDDKLWRIKHFDVGGKKIRFDSLNISWVSKLKEEQGKLVFPINNYDLMSESDAAIRFIVMHHPMNWFHQSIYRDFRAGIRKIADIVISGHEHDGNVGLIYDAESDISAFVEGCVLQEKSHSIEGSSFNLVKLNLDERQFMSSRYSWDKTDYFESEEGSWTHYHDLPRKRGSVLKIQSEFENFISDPGAFLKHSGGEDIRLQDIYVYPDLKKVNQVGDNKNTFINSSKLKSITNFDLGVIIQGDEKSGRSSLIYQLYMEYHSAGMIPVIIKGKDIKKCADSDISRLIARAVKRQYGEKSLEVFDKESRNTKIVFIDNFDESDIKENRVRSDILSKFSSHFSRVVVSVGSIFDLKEVLEGDSAKFLNQFEHYHLQPFGYVLREKLIKKWVYLGADGHFDRTEGLSRINQAELLVNAVMDKLVIPSQPLYLLTLLQSIDVGRSGDFKESALGHYYHFLLTEALRNSGVPADKLNENFRYCASLAWEYSSTNKRDLSEHELIDFNNRYSAQWHTVDFSKKLKILVDAKVLYKSGNDFAFRYPYIYYYLKGLYIKDNLSDVDIRGKIKHWCNHLYVRDNANTILFLAHHTSDDFVVNCISHSLNKIFFDEPPVTFDGDTTHIQCIIENVSQLKYLGGDPESHRERVNEIKDNDADRSDGLMNHEELENELSLIAKMTMLFKSAEILGQILKDQYPKILRSKKCELIQDLFNGPLRTLSYLYKFIGHEPDALVSEIEGAINKKGDVISDEDRKLLAKKLAAHLVQLISCSFIMKAARSVSSDSLSDEIYSVVKNKTTAFKLIELAIFLDSPKALPRQKLEDLYEDNKKDLIVEQVIQLMVVNRLYLFHTSESDMNWLKNKTFKLDINIQHKINYQEKNRKLLK